MVCHLSDHLEIVVILTVIMLSLKVSTVCLHAEYQERPSGDGTPTGEWALTDVASGSQLGSEQRVTEKGIPTSSVWTGFEGVKGCSPIVW